MALCKVYDKATGRCVQCYEVDPRELELARSLHEEAHDEDMAARPIDGRVYDDLENRW